MYVFPKFSEEKVLTWTTDRVGAMCLDKIGGIAGWSYDWYVGCLISFHNRRRRVDKAPAYIRNFIFIGVLFIYCVSSAVANGNVRGVSGGQCYGNSCVVYAIRKTHIRESLHLYPYLYLSLCFNCVRLFIALGDLYKQPNCGVFKARSLPLSLSMHICIRDEREFAYFEKH